MWPFKRKVNTFQPRIINVKVFNSSGRQIKDLDRTFDSEKRMRILLGLIISDHTMMYGECEFEIDVKLKL